MRDVTQSTRVVGRGFLALARVKKPCSRVAAVLLNSLAVVICCGMMHGMEAQAADPTMLDPNLEVRTVVAGLNQPTTMAFLGPTDILVLEKATGKVQRVVNGMIQSTVLDLAVNSASERGLLGIALHRAFQVTPGSTCSGRRAPPGRTATSWRRCPCWAIGWTASRGMAPPSRSTAA